MTVPDATASSPCSSHWNNSPMACSAIASAFSVNDAIRLSTWFCTEVASTMAAFATPCTCLVASATCPMRDVVVSVVHSSCYTRHCAMANPTSDTVCRGSMEIERQHNSAWARANAELGALDDIVVELPAFVHHTVWMLRYPPTQSQLHVGS